MILSDFLICAKHFGCVGQILNVLFCLMLKPDLTTEEAMERIGTPLVRGVLRLVKTGNDLDATFSAGPPEVFDEEGNLTIENPNPDNLDFLDFHDDGIPIDAPFHIDEAFKMTGFGSLIAPSCFFDFGTSDAPVYESFCLHFASAMDDYDKGGDCWDFVDLGYLFQTPVVCHGDTILRIDDDPPYFPPVREACYNAQDAVFYERTTRLLRDDPDPDKRHWSSKSTVVDGDAEIVVSYWICPYGFLMTVDDSGDGFDYEKLKSTVGEGVPGWGGRNRGILVCDRDVLYEVWFEKLRSGFRTLLLLVTDEAAERFDRIREDVDVGGDISQNYADRVRNEHVSKLGRR